MPDISALTLPNGSEVNIKDSMAREAISQLNSFDYIVSSSAENTPKGISFKSDEDTTVDGELEASPETRYKIYLVPSNNGTNDVYDEYLTVQTDNEVFVWEKIGNTDIDLSEYVPKLYAENTYAKMLDPIFQHSISLGRASTGNIKIGDNSIVVGSGAYAEGSSSSAFGISVIANGLASHAEGISTKAVGVASHAEGYVTGVPGATVSLTSNPGDTTDYVVGVVNLTAGHMEGYNTGVTASGPPGAHAEGYQTYAAGGGSHSEGYETIVKGMGGHSEGYETYSSGIGAHSEGNVTVAFMDGAHSEGLNNVAMNRGAHAEGNGTVARGEGSHAEGKNAFADGKYSHAEGLGVAHNGAYNKSNIDPGGHISDSKRSYLPGAFGEASHVEGAYTLADGQGAHAEGYECRAEGGWGSHAEGHDTESSGAASHAEGSRTKASASYSHAEGLFTIADGYASHAGGSYNALMTRFDEWNSETAYNFGDIVTYSNGMYRSLLENNRDKPLPSDNWEPLDYSTKELFVIGNGTSDENRSNAFEVHVDGRVKVQKSLIIGGTEINEALLIEILNAYSSAIKPEPAEGVSF